MDREELTFPSGDGHCAAWLYRPSRDAAGDVPCVVMGNGFSMTRHDGLPPYAERLAAAGLAVLVFDYRHFGDSPGTPRRRFRVSVQHEDWRSAVAFARTLPGVDARRLVLWAYSFGAVGSTALAARAPEGIAAMILMHPFLDGLARTLATPPPTIARIVPKAVADAAGRHTTIPVTTEPGEHGAMSLPGEAAGFAATILEGSPWRNEVSPAVFLTVAMIRPVRLARKLIMPLWIAAGERDVSVSRKAIERLALLAPHAELASYDIDHFGAWTGDAPGRIAGDQVAFLARHGLTAG